MTRTKALVAGLFGAFAFASNAHAADPAGSWPPPPQIGYERPEPQFRELASGWYLRGDFNYHFNAVASIDSPSAISRTTADRSFSGTFGFGYKYQWWRGDVTFDLGSPWTIKGSTVAPTTQPEYLAKVTSRDVMINGYVDLGTWGGFTPYVGGGVGVALLTDRLIVDNVQVGTRGKAENITYAAMAGVAYQVAPRWVVDVGYRYRWLGDLKTPDGRVPAVVPTFNGLTSQEVRLGVRFLFD